MVPDPTLRSHDVRSRSSEEIGCAGGTEVGRGRSAARLHEGRLRHREIGSNAAEADRETRALAGRWSNPYPLPKAWFALRRISLPASPRAWIRSMLRKEQNELLTQTGPGTPWASCSAPTGFRRCSTRNWRRTTARRCGSSCCRSGSSPSATATAGTDWSTNSAPTAGSRYGSAATRRPACAALITAGNTTSPASASRCRRSRLKAGSAGRSSSSHTRW